MKETSGVLLLLSIKLSLELRVTFWQSKQSDFYLLSQYGAGVSVHVCVCFTKRERKEREKGEGVGVGGVPLKMERKKAEQSEE